MSRIVHVHASGRFDASKNQTIMRLKYIKALGANVITLTEVAFLHDALVAFAGDEWGVFHPHGPGRGENAVLWKLSDFTIKDSGSDLITHMHLRVGRKAPLYASTVVLEVNNTHKQFLVSTTHLPAHLDVAATLNGKGGNWPSVVHRSASRGWHRSLRKYGVKPRIVAADWNMDFTRKLVQLYAKSRFPSLKMGWNFKTMPRAEKKYGTHGRRFIDTVLSNLKRISASRVFHTSAGFDHRLVKTIYDL